MGSSTIVDPRTDNSDDPGLITNVPSSNGHPTINRSHGGSRTGVVANNNVDSTSVGGSTSGVATTMPPGHAGTASPKGAEDRGTSNVIADCDWLITAPQYPGLGSNLKVMHVPTP